jgi:hypothetical protein
MVQAHGWAELILGLNHYVSETSYFWPIHRRVLFYTLLHPVHSQEKGRILTAIKQ